MTTTPSAGPSDDPAYYRSLCTRALNGHGVVTAAEILAAVPTDLGIDRYGAGGAVAALEVKIAELLGKPAAVFFVSGTMAQQIALRVHADRRSTRTVAWHPTCHLEIHEEKAYQWLHGLTAVHAGSPRELFALDDLRALPDPLAAVLFELPQREIGGQLPAWDDLRQQVEHVKGRGAAAHLDGARLWESAPFYERSIASIAGLFDTVYVSFYKGLGALPGCCLAGDDDVIREARVWRKRHGGTLFAMWPNAASATAALEKRWPRMTRYVEHAKRIAERLAAVPGVRVTPDPPHTNMMHLHLRSDEGSIRSALVRVARERGVFLWPGTEKGPDDTRAVELTVEMSASNLPP